MNAFERFSAIIQGEEPDLVGVMAATGLRRGSQGGIYQRFADRGLCLRDIVPPHQPFFTFPGCQNPYITDIVYTRKDYYQNGNWHEKHILDTPMGSISSVVRRNLEIDVSSGAPHEHFIKEEKDWDVTNYLFKRIIEHLRPNYSEMERNQDAFGSRGLTLALIDRTPYQRAWIELASLEQTVLSCYDPSPGFKEYVELQIQYHQKVAEIAAGCPSDLVLINDNITNTISPTFYREYCIPVYQIYQDAFIGTNKILAVHHDGLLNSLSAEISTAPFQIVDSFTLPPSGDVPLKEVKSSWKGKTLFINLPPFLAYEPEDRLSVIYKKVIDEWGSKKIAFVHVEDYPLEQVETHLKVLLDVCGY